MQFGAGKPPVGVVFDTEFGAHACDALAMALLYALDGKNECRVSAVSVSRPALNSAAAAEVIGRFYAGAVSGAFAAFGRTLPVGLASNGQAGEDPALVKGILEEKKLEHGIKSLNDTAEPHPLMRNALTAQHDQNAMVISTGRLTNLKMLLELPGAKPWIERKARYLVIGATDQDLAADSAATKKVLSEWPTEILLADEALGNALPFPMESLDRDYAWAAEKPHPVVLATKAAGPVKNTTAMAAVLQAVRPGEKYFSVVPGEGRMKRLKLDEAQKAKVLEAYTTLASAKPVVRGPRRPPTA